MTLRSLVSFCVVLLAVGARPAMAGSYGPNLITNGNFAGGTTGTGSGSVGSNSVQVGYSFTYNSVAYNLNATGWVSTQQSGYNVLYNASTATTTGAVTEWGGTGEKLRAIPGPDGSNAYFMGLDGGNGGCQATRCSDSFYQQLNNLVIGTVYTVTFDAAAAQLATGSGSWNESLEVNLQTTIPGSITLAANPAVINFINSVKSSTTYNTTTFQTGDYATWATYSYSFEATSATEYLAFLALGAPANPPFALLDNVSMYAVPEPASLAILAAGLGAIAFAARRRRAV